MFSRRKAEEKPSASGRKPRGTLPILGLDADLEEDGEGDEDLERELAALVGGGGRKKPKLKKKARVNILLLLMWKNFFSIHNFIIAK